MIDIPKTPVETPKSKKPLQILRERLGGVPRERMERNREQITNRKNIVAALEEGAKTVPELAEAVELPSHEVLWYVMGMKKYGTVVEAEPVDGYFKYALVQEVPQAEAKS